MSRHLSPDTERRALDELLATRSRIDLLEQERDEAKKAFKSIISEEWSRERFLLGILRGTVSEQLAPSGMDAGMVERSRKIGSALRAAIEAMERLTGVSAEAEVEDSGGDGDGTEAVLRAAARVRDAQAGLEKVHPGAKASLHVGTKAELDKRLHEVIHPEKVEPFSRGPGLPKRSKSKGQPAPLDGDA
jgi:hypothetical protein